MLALGAAGLEVEVKVEDPGHVKGVKIYIETKAQVQGLGPSFNPLKAQ